MRRLLLSFILICLLAIPASAHPGGTDSSGGHYDHSTGEYHYHHGYGPHEHEDLDGDGDLDCPYSFKDRTGDNSGESSGSTTRYPAYTRPVTPPAIPVPTVPAVTEPIRAQEPKGTWLEGLFTALIPFWLMLAFVLIRDVLPYLFTKRNTRMYYGPPAWESHPKQVPLKAASPPKPPVKQLSFFEEPKPEQTGDPGKLIWKSAYEEMKYTRITDRYIHIKDLELVAGCFSVDTDTALRLLNDDRIHNDMPPLELLEV